MSIVPYLVANTIDSLPHGTRIEDPFEFKVTDVEREPSTKRSHIIQAEDSEGNDFRFEVWETHYSRYMGWREGVRYRVRESIVGGDPPVLSSTDDLEVEILDEETRGSIVVMSDTHIGFGNRPKNRRLPERRMEKIDCIETFEIAVEKILDIQPDSVIHAGDIFDDDVKESEVERFNRCIDRLEEAGIIFYYVRGNHGDLAGGRAVSGHNGCVHLRWKGKEVRNAVLYGVNEEHDTEQWLNGSSLQRKEMPHIGVFHNELEDEEIADSDLDLFIRGHYHDGKNPDSPTQRGEDTLCLYPGSTESISKNYSNWGDQEVSIWELKFSDDRIDWERHGLMGDLKELR